MEADQSIAVEIDLYRFNSDKDCKKYELGISTGTASSYERRLYNGTSTVAYNFYETDRTTRIIKDIGDGNKDNNVSIDFKKNYYKKVIIYAKMPNPYESGNLLPGQYADTVSINIVPKKKNTTGGTSKNISLYLNVQSDLSICLVDKGQPYEEGRTNYALMYGTLVEGQTKGLDLIIKSNSGYRVTVSSENDGRLTHTNSTNYKIDYSFIVNGQSRSLVGSKNNPTEIYYSPVASHENGDVVDIDVSIGSVAGKLAGPYRDYIYFNAISTH
jgi:hypothetical protein